MADGDGRYLLTLADTLLGLDFPRPLDTAGLALVSESFFWHQQFANSQICICEPTRKFRKNSHPVGLVQNL